MLTELAPDVRAYEYDVYMPGRVHFPCRTVVVRLPGGGLWLHSPGPIADSLAAELERWGPVEHLVAPSLLHHLFLGQASARWPQARTWGAAGLGAKRPDLRLDATLGQDEAPWAEVLAPMPIAGAPFVGETVFLHRPSGSLLVTDLLFNIHRWNTPQTAWVLWMVGAQRRLASSRAWRMWVKDKAAYGRSVREVVAAAPRRLIPAHGDVIDALPAGALPEALAWACGLPG